MYTTSTCMHVIVLKECLVIWDAHLSGHSLQL